jgi:hypothetical protein
VSRIAPERWVSWFEPFDSQLRNYECENWYDTGPRFGVRKK